MEHFEQDEKYRLLEEEDSSQYQSTGGECQLLGTFGIMV
jgi:hypothetical protein